jgi:NAD(P)-dependent dehydrogenase (short-subunit alcohol dehydrogenase family)
MTDFSNRVAVVTGGAAGIGAAIVRSFVAAGAKVGFCDIDADRGKDLEGQLNGRALFAAVDVGDRPAVDAFVTAVAERFSGIDILVNNAGITHDRTYFGDLDFSTWSHVFDVNLNGIFFVTQAVLPHMVRRRGGSIVNVGSILADALFPGKTAYATSKAAVAGFSRALALDLSNRAIRVNCLIPGSTDTEMMWRGLDGEARAVAETEAGADIPLGRVGSPEELATAAVFLASDEASYITGTSLLVDGGLLARIAARR